MSRRGSGKVSRTTLALDTTIDAWFGAYIRTIHQV
jgi:hypothetical protein